MPGKYTTEQCRVKFWEKTNATNLFSCWEWQGKKNKDGYGVVVRNGKYLPAHRYAFGIVYGKIPDGLSVLHKCDNPPCVNPAHLYAGTQKQNIHDMLSRGRRPSRKGIKHPLAKLTECDVLEIRRLLKNGVVQKDIAIQFCVTQSQISQIKLRKSWSHLK